MPLHPSECELVAFDIDGTLLATDRFWLGIGRRAVREAYERHGVARELPADAAFLGAIGLPADEFWRAVLPADLGHLAAEAEARSQDLEGIAFAQGLGAMYPGALELLETLRADGRFLGLASNCGRRYLESFVESFGLAGVIHEARCADSPGVGSKADMLEEIVLATGAASAVMIGDRNGDREAAMAHGFPFVLFTGGFDPVARREEDHVVRDYRELAGLLRSARAERPR